MVGLAMLIAPMLPAAGEPAQHTGAPEAAATVGRVRSENARLVALIQETASIEAGHGLRDQGGDRCGRCRPCRTERIRDEDNRRRWESSARVYRDLVSTAWLSRHESMARTTYVVRRAGADYTANHRTAVAAPAVLRSRIIMSTPATIVTAVALVVGLHASAPGARAQDAEVVIQWNEVMQSLHGTGASDAQRSYAMLHIAMFDAVNSIVDTYTPYRVHVRGSRGASQTAAAAEAAHDILTTLFPGEQERFDALRAAQLRGVPRGMARQGLAIGRRAARAILAWRQDDGWPAAIVPDPTYDLPPFPGLW